MKQGFGLPPELAGGSGWAGFFALFMEGVAMGAKAILPRWVAAVGYFLAAVSAVATLVLVTIMPLPACRLHASSDSSGSSLLPYFPPVLAALIET